MNECMNEWTDNDESDLDQRFFGLSLVIYLIKIENRTHLMMTIYSVNDNIMLITRNLIIEIKMYKV